MVQADVARTSQPSATPGRVGRLAPWLAAGALGAAVYLFYLPVYRARGFRVPVGFDTPWYVWRADFVAERGLGPLDTAVRPGHALLSAVLGAVTGRSQLQLAVVLPLVLVAVLALAVGALAVAGLGAGQGRLRWAVTVALAGTVLATTRLVGENVANLLNLAMVVAALAALLGWVAGARRGLAGTVALLIAAGLAHWVFLAVFGAVFAVAAALSLPSTLRELREGRSWVRTPAGALGAAVVAAGAAMAAVIAGVLHAPFQTIEIKEDPTRFLPKLRTDLSRLEWPLTAPAAAVGAWLLGRSTGPTAQADRERVRRMFLRLLVAWVVVCGVGVLYGALTKNLPPHRFLALIVAVPFVLALAETVRWLATRPALARFRIPVTVAAVAALAVPGALSWYLHGPGEWIDPVGVQEAGTASAYVASLPTGGPVVFLVGPFGAAGVVSVPLKERTIRAGLPASQQERFHLFAGEPGDLLAGRRTLVPGFATNDAIGPYWDDVRTVLPSKPPVIVLKAFGGKQFQETLGLGATVIGPGVALLQGPHPAAKLPAAAVPPMVPGLARGAVEGLAVLVLLGLAGAGGTWTLFGPGLDPEVWASLSPAVGAGMLSLVAFVAAELGVRLAGAGGALVFVATVLAGGLPWLIRTLRSTRRPG
ncbi:MAG TPA: hypothetical protein DIT48_04630 [Actinobacteria bacterium]|nr:hypothetical protein [Actinomycetota bacterium]